MSKADSASSAWSTMRATDTYDPRALGDCLIGSDDAGVAELDRNGRSLNRPVLDESVPNQGVQWGHFTQETSVTHRLLIAEVWLENTPTRYQPKTKSNTNWNLIEYMSVWNQIIKHQTHERSEWMRSIQLQWTINPHQEGTNEWSKERYA
jgi:hypothetical protein